MEYEKVSLANLANGAAVELFDRELSNVLDNIADRNTKSKAARKVVLEVTIVPTEDRALGAVSVKCASQLAPASTFETSFEFVQEGRRQVAFQRKAKQGELGLDNVVEFESKGG